MKCIAEARQWKLRVYSDDNAQYGQPFDWAASMQRYMIARYNSELMRREIWRDVRAI